MINYLLSPLADISGLILLVTFSILGFGAYMFADIIYLFCQWWEEQPINWKWETFALLAIPIAYVVVVLELLAILGIFPKH